MDINTESRATLEPHSRAETSVSAHITVSMVLTQEKIPEEGGYKKEGGQKMVLPSLVFFEA